MSPSCLSPFRLSPSAPSPASSRTDRAVRPILALLAVALGLTAVAIAPPRPAAAATHAFGDPIFSADARGDITTVGNVTTTCDPSYANARWSAAESAAACNGARNGATDVRNHAGAVMPPINNRLSMAFVDVDQDPGTFSSSTARLDLPAGAAILWAGLHWNGATKAPVSPTLYGSDFQAAPPSLADRFQVVLRTPGSARYRSLSAAPADGVHTDTWDSSATDATRTYGGFVDITSLVKAAGSGDYTVGDVQACRGFGGCFASWSITVAFAERSLPARNLNVWHGWQVTSPLVNHGDQQFTVSGLAPPPSGPVNARIGVVQADGDRGLGPDSLDISSPSTPWTTFRTADRPLHASEAPDWFNSTTSILGSRRASADASPNYLANLDQDIALEQTESVVHNTDHSLSFRVHTAGTEGLFSQVVHSAVEIHQPTIAITKSVSPAGPVHTGDRVTWTLEVANTGIDAIRRAVVTDALPPGLLLVPGSVRYAAGGPAAILGTKTEAAGDDQVDFDPASRILRFRAGAGADAAAGGTVGIAPAADGSDSLTITFATIVDLPAGTSITNVAKAHGEGRQLADPFGPLVTDAHDDAPIATIAVSDLGITKSDDGAVVRKVGDRFTYRIAVSNAGPSDATGVVVTDPLDRRLRFVRGTGCVATGQAVSCRVGTLADGASTEVSMVVEVVELPGPGNAVPNIASVSGDQPDPDCVAATPDAHCNHDDETTPQPAIDVGIDKTDHDAVVRAVGDTYRYGLKVTNGGPDDATGVTVTDELDPMLQFVRSQDCTAVGRKVSCAVAKLAAGATASLDLEVRVVRLPEPGHDIPNVATVSAAEPDPDCDASHPTATCNHDEESTPRTTPKPPPSSTTTVLTTPAGAHPAPPQPEAVTLPVVGRLPRTGIELGGLAVLGLALAAGGAAVLWGRRRAAGS